LRLIRQRRSPPQHNVITLIFIAFIGYVATNVDNASVLLTFLSSRQNHARATIAGYVLGSMALIVGSLACARLLVHVSSNHLALLGLVPLTIGIIRLFDQLLSFRGGYALEPQHVVTQQSSALTVLFLSISNGGDNFAVYTSLFATRSFSEVLIIGLSLVAMTVVYCILGEFFVSRFASGLRIQHVCEIALPWLLMGIGVSILRS
jgi:cadmium resistance protein CadD (predicted permease)